MHVDDPAGLQPVDSFFNRLAAIHDFYRTADYADVTDGNMFLATYSLRVLEFGRCCAAFGGSVQTFIQVLGNVYVGSGSVFSPRNPLLFYP